MLRCATCGKTGELRLYYLECGDRVERRWWCPECWFAARRLGLKADAAPVWIERAALNRLPMKPLETGFPATPVQTSFNNGPDDPTQPAEAPTAMAPAIASRP